MKETPFLEAREEILNQFKNIPFFASFGGDHLKEIINSSKIRIYAEGETIIQEGDRDSWIYILMSGEVHVMKKGGHLTTLNNTGDLFGELAIIGDKRRSASVIARSGTTCLAINAAIFEGTNTDKAVFYAIIFRLLAESLGARLRVTNEEISKMRMEIDMLKATLITSGRQ
jgi:CRP/FNR family transcriptional regulator, cyclic AMP receptor protein